MILIVFNFLYIIIYFGVGIVVPIQALMQIRSHSSSRWLWNIYVEMGGAIFSWMNIRQQGFDYCIADHIVIISQSTHII